MNCINRCNDKTFRRILGVGEGDADHMVPDLVKHPQHLTHVDVGLGVIVGQETLTKGSGLQSDDSKTTEDSLLETMIHLHNTT